MSSGAHDRDALAEHLKAQGISTGLALSAARPPAEVLPRMGLLGGQPAGDRAGGGRDPVAADVPGPDGVSSSSGWPRRSERSAPLRPDADAGTRHAAESTVDHARSAGHRPAGSKRIWIDLDNTPHVPFFVPIIRALEREGHSVIVTARDAFQVCSLADYHGLEVPEGRAALRCQQGHEGRRHSLAGRATAPDRPARAAAHIDVARVPAAGVAVVSARHPEHAACSTTSTRWRLPFVKPALGVAPDVNRRSRVGQGVQVRPSYLPRAEGGRVRSDVPAGPVNPGPTRRRQPTRSW